MKFIITQNMIKNIKIKESQLQKLIYNILDNESFKKKKTIQEEIETIVDFHRRLYTSIFISQGNILEFESRKELYIKNIFSNNKKIIKEYYDKFNNNLLKESKNKPKIDKFFDFIKENLIEQSNFKLLNEAQNITSIGASIIKAIKGAGTDEEGVLKAIKQLKSKEEVYHLNNYIKSKTGENLKDYINNDMSDYDSEEYRAIWGHLGKFGFTGGNFSILLASIGKAAKAIGKGFQWLKENGLGWFMDKIRNFLDSGWGAAAQIFLDSFGIGAIGVVVVWGIMVVWDLINVNELGWGRLFFSCLSLLTAGAMSAVIGPLANLIKGFKGGFKDIIKKIFSSPLANSFKSWIPKITAGASKVAEWISKGVNWLLSKLSSYIPKNWVSTINGAVDKAVNWVKSLVDDINKLSSTPISKSVVTTIITKSGQKIPSLSSLLTNPKWVNVMKGLDDATAKIVDDYILKNAKNYTWEQIETGVCNQNKNACNPVKYLGDAYRLKTSSKQGVKDFATKVSDVSTRYGEKEQKT